MNGYSARARGAAADPIAALREALRTTRPDADVDLLRRAYDVAAHFHHGQFRRSGDPYVTHPVTVATILARLGADDRTLCAAILHDTVEDTPYTLSALSRAPSGQPGRPCKSLTFDQASTREADTPARLVSPGPRAAGDGTRRRGGRGAVGRGAARNKSTARDLGAFICFEHGAGQGLRPPKGRTWAPRGARPVVRVRGAGGGRVSIAGAACYRPGDRPHLYYHLLVYRRRKGEAKGVSWPPA